MRKHKPLTFAAGLALAAASAAAAAADLTSGFAQGTPEVKAAGPLAFGPEGILFVADPKSAVVFAVATGDAAGAESTSSHGKVEVEGLDGKIAAALGTGPDQVMIEDLAVNPADGGVYLSVSRGRGPDATPVLLRVAEGGQVEEVPLENVRFASMALENAPADEGEGRRNQRRESITDLAFVEGRLIVAGLSNEEFASKLRAFEFPFSEADPGTSVEIFHGSHGKVETRSPVRTFLPLDIDGQPHLVAAYTCTPLVTIPVKELAAGKKVRGTTVAELGNHNRPLDMISYSRDGQGFILMANSDRGVMRIPTAGIGDAAGIEERIPDTAGVPYETVAGLEGVTQLDKLDDAHAVVVVQKKEGGADLKTIELP